MFALYVTSPEVNIKGKPVVQFATRLADKFEHQHIAEAAARDTSQALKVRAEVWGFGDREPCYVVKPLGTT